MLSTHKNASKLLTLASAFVAAMVFTTAASAMLDSSRSQSDLGVTQQNATSGGGVTPTDLARAVPRESNAPGGVTPTDLARSVPNVHDISPQLSKAPPVAKSDTEWNLGFAHRDLALGFGFGLAVAIVFSLALVTSRNRRIAHS